MEVYGNGAALGYGQDEFFSGQNSEGGEDANLEWLSMLVEDCLSAAPIHAAIAQHRPPPATELSILVEDCLSAAPSHAAIAQHRPPPAAASVVSLPTQVPLQPSLLLAAASVVSLPTQVPLQPSLLLETRGKRKLPRPPLLQQRYWLADSELILQHVSMNKKTTPIVSGVEEMAKGEGQQSRRCTHCQTQKTPQWRTGPMGPKSLCNACGVRFKSGRLLPEYRPAKSPTFVSYKHSNSHKKVMEMRMRMMSSQQSNSH